MRDVRSAFSYAVLRVVPRVERGERVNVGVVLLCRELDYLGARIALDEKKLRALDPELDPTALGSHLEGIMRIATGDMQGGPIAALPPGERFGWLVAPASTIVQPSAVHTGLCTDPAATLDRLFTDLVA